MVCQEVSKEGAPKINENIPSYTKKWELGLLFKKTFFCFSKSRRAGEEVHQPPLPPGHAPVIRAY